VTNITFVFETSPNAKPKEKKVGGHGILCPPRLKKWGGHVPLVPHQIAPMLVTKREVSNIAKLADFKSVFAPILTYDPESWVMTEVILSQGQRADIGFLKSRPWCDTSRQSAQL